MDAKWGHSLERIGIQDSILAIPEAHSVSSKQNFLATNFPSMSGLLSVLKYSCNGLQ